MNITIEVKDDVEAAAIKAALADPTTRAAVLVVGLLLPLSDRCRRRVMTFVIDEFAEQAERKPKAKRSKRP